MRCCVPSCNNTPDNVITTDGNGISFHGFPREGSLRAAWLSALGKQGGQLPDAAVVCSRHFLDDDFCETESGFRQLVAGVIPSAVQVCMICLDTDSKLCLMSKLKLEQAYEQLTGHPILCDAGDLKRTLCVQCAQKLRNFSRFRDKSLRAHALMMDLVDKHEQLTIQHIQMIDRTKHQLKSDIVWTVLGPNLCDLYIQEHPSEDKQTELEETVHSNVVKTEAMDDSVLVDGDTEMTNEDDNNVYAGFVACNEECLSDENIRLDVGLCKALKGKAPAAEQVTETQDLIKCESALIQCILCTEEFLHAHEYMQHMHLHLQSGAGEEACAASQVCRPQAAERSDPSLSALGTEDKFSIWKQNDEPRPSADFPPTVVVPWSTRLATNNANKVHKADTIRGSEGGPETDNGAVAVSNNKTHINIDTLTNCVVKLYDCKKFKVMPRQDGSLTKTRKAVSSYENQNIDNVPTIFKEYVATSHNVPTTENIEPATNEVRVNKHNLSKSLQSETGCSNNSIIVQLNNAAENNSNTFPEKKSFACDVWRKMFKRKYLLVKHVQTHNEVKYICKSTANMQRYTALKPYACDLCKYKSSYKSNLRGHMRTHTGEKPYWCELCTYKSAYKHTLVNHMRTHTREKPFLCSLCEYKCSTDTRLVKHMRTHTGEKPFSCILCEYKCSTKYRLVEHVRIHTGEKPYSCNLCEYKCSTKCRLVVHMRIHTGEKPYSCELCNCKCTRKAYLVRHMRTHTGENSRSTNIEELLY